jgi:hypothetical protein
MLAIFNPGYAAQVRNPRYDLVFALPLLVAYELLAFSLSQDAITGVRNGADVVLKSLFLAAGGRWGLVAFGVLLVGGASIRVLMDIRTNGPPVGKVFLGMTAEAVVYALLFGGVTGLLTAIVLGQWSPLAVGPFDQLDLPTQLMISLGAGLYEELLFRVLLVGGLALVGRKVFGWSTRMAAVFAVAVGAVVFSAFHYIGPYGDPFAVPSFTFRTIAGVLFSALYLLRGFGITAWTHALYDVFLALSVTQ